MTLKRMIRANGFAATLAFGAGAAFAGGLTDPVAPAPVPAPPPAPMSQDWTGPYVGVQVGVSNSEVPELEQDPDIGSEFSGTFYGVHAGYLYDFGSLVAGAELEYNLPSLDDPLVVPGVGDVGLEVDYVALAKLRVGFDAGNILPYLTAGAAQGAGSVIGGEAEDTGTFFGGGVDYQFNPNIRAGAEVLMLTFEDFDDTGVDITTTTAALRLSYTF